MDISYHKHFSDKLGRDMEYKRYGHAGRPVVVFPTSQGRFFQFEDSGGVGALAEFIDTGRIQLFTVDGIDSESFFNKHVDAAQRIARHEAYFRYVREEALPEILSTASAANGGRKLKPLFSGCSMGGYHSSNFVFRFPRTRQRRHLAVGCLFGPRFLRQGAGGRHLLQLAARLPARHCRSQTAGAAEGAEADLLLRARRLGRTHAGRDAPAGTNPARQVHSGLGRLLGRRRQP